MPDNEFASAAVTVKAPDGTEFGILRHAPENAVELRGEALVVMRKISQQREPELLQYLQTHGGVSAEYAMSSGLMHSKLTDVKADLLGVMIDEDIAEGHRGHAVGLLVYANAAELPVADRYGTKFVTDQYGAAMQEEDWFDAWRIADLVTRKGDRIAPGDWSSSGEWRAREKLAFERYAEKTLAEVKPDANPWDHSTLELQTLFNLMTFRDDGFSAETPSELSRRIADAYIKLQLGWGRRQTALELAVEAGMPEDYIRGIGPEGLEKFFSRVEQVRDKVLRLLGR